MNRHDYFKAFLITVPSFLLSMLFLVNFASLNTKHVTNPESTLIPDQTMPTMPSISILNESATPIPTPTPPPSSSPLLTQSPQDNPFPTTPNTHVFTWISHSINESMAQWLLNMGFTDVCIRHVTYEEFKTSKSVLAEYGINLWDHVSPDFFLNDSSVQDFTNSIDSVLTYRSNFIVDDCHSLFHNGNGWNESQKANFLTAAACYPKNVMLTFCEPVMCDWAQYNFSHVNMDLYCTPDQYDSTVVSNVKDRCLSLGIYLWIWNGSGINWEIVTQQQIAQTYTLAELCGANRFIVWMGDESDEYEQGMSLSSLYRYPEWYSFIADCNWSFRD